MKDGKLFYSGNPNDDWEDFKKLRDIEKEADMSPGKWKVILYNPLRGATWERQENGRWVLTETNQGFA